MACFLTLYIGSAAEEKAAGQPDAATQQKGMEAWGQWATEHQGSIVENGAPLGKTLKVDPSGVSDTSNLMDSRVR